MQTNKKKHQRNASVPFAQSQDHKAVPLALPRAPEQNLHLQAPRRPVQPHSSTLTPWQAQVKEPLLRLHQSQALPRRQARQLQLALVCVAGRCGN